MWFQFMLASFLALTLFYLPGYLIIRGCLGKSYLTASLSPVISTALFSLLAILLPQFNVEASPLTLIGSALVIAIMLSWSVRCLVKKSTDCNMQNLDCFRDSSLPIYIIIGVVISLLVFVKNLDGPDSILQEYDNWMHLGMVRTFIESSNFSSFNSLYQANEITPFRPSFGFYPSAWHAFVALAAESVNTSIPIAVNAVNFVITGVIFPTSIYALIKYLFHSDRFAVLCGAFVSVGVATFPWDFLSFGPLYPNLLSMALVPAVATLFMVLVDNLFSRKLLLLFNLSWLFLLSALAIVLSQPNGIFTLAVLLTPFIVSRVYQISKSQFADRSYKPVFFSAVATLLIVLVWVICYKLPSFQNVVHFNWPATESFAQGLIDAVCLSTTWYPAQLWIFICTVFGCFSLVKNDRLRWLIFPYLYSVAAYAICVATEGTVKHVMAGFWYTDPHRLGALIALISIPIATKGLSSLIGVLRRFFIKFFRSSAFIKQCGIYLAYLVFMIIIFFPSFELRGIASIQTPFGFITNQISAQNFQYGSNVLTAAERDFAERALELVPDGSIIINEPNDGSAFLYALYDAPVLYRKFDLPATEEETYESRMLRSDLYQIEYNPDIRKIVSSINAEYVLLLDHGEDEVEGRRRFWSYFPDQWVGIESICDDTPGFKLLLSEGDMRFYRIE